MSVRSIALILFVSILAAACTTERTPASPTETFKTYTKAIKQKDTATMKLLLSRDTIKIHQLEAQAQGVSLDDIIKRETLFTEDQKSVKYRNEKIDGYKATLEVEDSFGSWEIVPFVNEDGEWKIDKKGFAQQLIDENEKSNKELDDLINQGKQQQP